MDVIGLPVNDLLLFHVDAPIVPAVNPVELQVVQKVLSQGVVALALAALPQKTQNHTEEQIRSYPASIRLTELPLLQHTLIDENEIFHFGVELQCLLDLL